MNPQVFKKRKGFRLITIDGQIFQFNWANNPDGPCLILYGEDGGKIQLTYESWKSIEDSAEYISKPKTWHGKRKTEACFGGWGKAEAREMYLKYVRSQKTVQNLSNRQSLRSSSNTQLPTTRLRRLR